MSKIMKFQNDEIMADIETIKVGEEIWFKGKDVAKALDYNNTRQAIIAHVDDEDKTMLKNLESRGLQNSPPKGSLKNRLPQGSLKHRLPCDSTAPQPNENELKSIYINESGLYSLIIHSKKEEAKVFKRWITSEVIPSIRKTGQYSVKQSIVKSPQIQILNETNLHYKVIDFIRKFYPDAIVIAGLGEHQDTQRKRCDAFYKGYRGGQPDILILNRHKTFEGLAIELKTPTGKGKVSDNQTLFLEKLNDNNFKVIINNDYDEIIVELIEYFRNIRLQCKLCSRCFKTSQTLTNHLTLFHKVEPRKQ